MKVKLVLKPCSGSHYIEALGASMFGTSVEAVLWDKILPAVGRHLLEREGVSVPPGIDGLPDCLERVQEFHSLGGRDIHGDPARVSVYEFPDDEEIAKIILGRWAGRGLPLDGDCYALEGEELKKWKEEVLPLLHSWEETNAGPARGSWESGPYYRRSQD